VRRALDELPLEYVVDEVVRRVAGTGTGNVTLFYRDGFVVNRSIVPPKRRAGELRCTPTGRPST
jgi:hypothetical protein